VPCWWLQRVKNNWVYFRYNYAVILLPLALYLLTVVMTEPGTLIVLAGGAALARTDLGVPSKPLICSIVGRCIEFELDSHSQCLWAHYANAPMDVA
jgi:hypothetical protein